MVKIFRLILVSLYIYIYINSTDIPPIMIINRIYETQKSSVTVALFLPGRAKDLSAPCTVALRNGTNKFTSFPYCTDTNNDPDMKEENSDRVRKLRNLFEILNKAFARFYSPSAHLAVDEVIVLFKGMVIFPQYVPEKHESFCIKIYKTCDQTVYTYDMTVYCLLVDTNSTHQRLVCPVSESEATKMSRVNCERCEVKGFQ